MDEDTLRYSKQLILEGFGGESQEKLKHAKILVIGAGGLGSPALLYLVSAGIGTIGIVDFDTVTLSNLNRQILYRTQDIGAKKTQVAENVLKSINPKTEIITFHTRVNIDNIQEIIESFDVVIDATDNLPTRYLISDACHLSGKPHVEGAATGYQGILMTIIPSVSPCYRCLYPIPPNNGVLPNCSNTGILGMVAGVIGTLQALEALKIVIGNENTLSGRVLIFDALTSSFDEMSLLKNSNCTLCGDNPSIKELVEYQINCKTNTTIA